MKGQTVLLYGLGRRFESVCQAGQAQPKRLYVAIPMREGIAGLGDGAWWCLLFDAVVGRTSRQSRLG